MLQAAVAMVSRDGLTVSLDHISLEEVIRDADVSRSAVYRRWPYKDLFFSDLVKELARGATPTIVDDEIALIQRIATEHTDWLVIPERRHGLMIELVRQLALFDFETLSGSARWRTYLALHATFSSLPDGELRDQVRAVLAQSEQEHRARVAKAWQRLADLFGYRLRPELGATFETLAALLDAIMRGLIIQALSEPGLGAYRAQARPFGADAPREWSLAALGAASMASAFLEPDPAIRWDDSRVAQVRHALSSLNLPEG